MTHARGQGLQTVVVHLDARKRAQPAEGVRERRELVVRQIEHREVFHLSHLLRQRHQQVVLEVKVRQLHALGHRRMHRLHAVAGDVQVPERRRKIPDGLIHVAEQVTAHLKFRQPLELGQHLGNVLELVVVQPNVAKVAQLRELIWKVGELVGAQVELDQIGNSRLDLRHLLGGDGRDVQVRDVELAMLCCILHLLRPCRLIKFGRGRHLRRSHRSRPARRR